MIIYTVSGGTKAVTQTQKQQMAVMMGGMVLAGFLVINMLPENISFIDALHVAGKMEKLNLVNFDFSLNDRYNFWTGTTAALFLFLFSHNCFLMCVFFCSFVHSLLFIAIF